MKWRIVVYKTPRSWISYDTLDRKEIDEAIKWCKSKKVPYVVAETLFEPLMLEESK